MEFHIQQQKSILWIFFLFYYPVLEKNMLLHVLLREDLSHKKEKTESSVPFKLKF